MFGTRWKLSDNIDMRDSMKEKVQQSKNLEGLLGNVMVAYALAECGGQHLDVDTALPQEYEIHLEDLPTFGGDEPLCTLDIYSWDKDRLLINEGRLDIRRKEIDALTRLVGSPIGNRINKKCRVVINKY